MRLLYFVLLSACFCLSANAQRLIDKAGTTSFFSGALLEDIKAENDECTAAMELSTGQAAVSMYMTDFEFENSLMQQHFNENYMESEKYPKATFSGRLKDFDSQTIRQSGSSTYTLVGEITIHGVTKPLETSVDFEYTEDGMLKAHTTFTVKTADFKIKIPKLLFQNIAEEIEITSHFQFNMNDNE